MPFKKTDAQVPLQVSLNQIICKNGPGCWDVHGCFQKLLRDSDALSDWEGKLRKEKKSGQNDFTDGFWSIWTSLSGLTIYVLILEPGSFYYSWNNVVWGNKYLRKTSASYTDSNESGLLFLTLTLSCGGRAQQVFQSSRAHSGGLCRDQVALGFGGWYGCHASRCLSES